MRYDLNHSRDLGSPQPRTEVMGPPEPDLSKANGQAAKTARVVKRAGTKPPKPGKQMETLSPAKYKQYMARIAEMERRRQITSKTARKLRAELHRQIPRSSRTP